MFSCIRKDKAGFSVVVIPTKGANENNLKIAFKKYAYDLNVQFISNEWIDDTEMLVKYEYY